MCLGSIKIKRKIEKILSRNSRFRIQAICNKLKKIRKTQKRSNADLKLLKIKQRRLNLPRGRKPQNLQQKENYNPNRWR